ncbi:MAG: hypothetical protein OEZ03_00735 [Alphaproteobacteria bacterium]|nr:hypothetical protein [Alphaproteobacteria bacterium]
MSVPTSIAEFFINAEPGEGIYDRITDSERAGIASEFKDLPGLIRDDLNKAFSEALDVGLADIFCGGWAKLQELQEYLDPDKHPPDEISQVSLAKHKIGSKHAPKLQLYLDEKLVAELAIDIELALKLEGIILRISSGRITDILTGTYQGTGKISCRGFTLAQENSGKFALPGEWTIKGGFPIPRMS